jgi:hypothetical protein
MKSAGIQNAVIVLAGWNCEGRDGLYPTRFPVEGAVGGADGMSRLVAAVRKAGYQPGALDNYTDMYRRSPAFNGEYCALQYGGKPWRGGVWAGGQAYIACPLPAQERYAKRDMRRLYDLGLQGMLYLDHCPGPGVLSCYHPEHPLKRAEYARGVVKLIHTAKSTFGLCRVSNLSVFAALAADSCRLPVSDTPSVGGLGEDWFSDESVPFLSIALHGIVLFSAEAGTDPLRAVESGAAPAFEVTAADALQVLEKMKAIHERHSKELAPLMNEFIDAHETPEEGVVRVRYASGAEVLVNYTDLPVEIDGLDVNAQDFAVRRPT